MFPSSQASRQTGKVRAPKSGLKDQANPLKRRGHVAWFFMRFRGPKALHNSFDGYPVTRQGKLRGPESGEALVSELATWAS